MSGHEFILSMCQVDLRMHSVTRAGPQNQLPSRQMRTIAA
jgi:hypothetical protein